MPILVSRNATILMTAAVVLSVGGCRQSPIRSVATLKRTTAEPQFEKPSKKQINELRLVMARSMEEKGQLDSARSAYEELVAAEPKNLQAHRRLAIVLDKQGKFAESDRLYQRAIRLAPDNADVRADYGFSLYLQKKWQEAEGQLLLALTYRPDHLRAQNNLGLVYCRQNRLDDAMDAFDRAGCSPAQTHMNLAFGLTMDKRLDDARRQYELAMAADPSSNEAKSRLGQIDRVIAASHRGSAETVELVGYSE